MEGSTKSGPKAAAARMYGLAAAYSEPNTSGTRRGTASAASAPSATATAALAPSDGLGDLTDGLPWWRATNGNNASPKVVPSRNQTSATRAATEKNATSVA